MGKNLIAKPAEKNKPNLKTGILNPTKKKGKKGATPLTCKYNHYKLINQVTFGAIGSSQLLKQRVHLFHSAIYKEDKT